MITIRKSGDRGHFDHGWLQTYHTFSFAGYRDPAHMGFRALRVINEDQVQGGEGFGTHPHRDMEIITYVTEGALRHQDSMGSTSVINAGEVQRMTAGTGITHSEMNESNDQGVHLFQIWIEPERLGLTPSYEQRQAWPTDAEHGLRLLASPDGDGDQAMKVHQDVTVLLGRLTGGNGLRYALRPGRAAWVQVVGGDVTVNGERVTRGDGLAVSDVDALELASDGKAEVLLFDLA